MYGIAYSSSAVGCLTESQTFNKPITNSRSSPPSLLLPQSSLFQLMVKSTFLLARLKTLTSSLTPLSDTSYIQHSDKLIGRIWKGSISSIWWLHIISLLPPWSKLQNLSSRWLWWDDLPAFILGILWSIFNITAKGIHVQPPAAPETVLGGSSLKGFTLTISSMSNTISPATHTPKSFKSSESFLRYHPPNKAYSDNLFRITNCTWHSQSFLTCSSYFSIHHLL